MGNREHGKIISWIIEKNFGFIAPDYPIAGKQSHDVFFHVSEVRPHTVRREDIGPSMRCTFEIVQGPRGWKAVEVMLDNVKGNEDDKRI